MKRNHKIYTTLSAEELQKAKAKAEKAGMTLSALLRNLILTMKIYNEE